jgi:hypothetical protein
LRSHLSLVGGPSSKKLLGIAGGYHLAFRANVLELSLRESARAAGFESSDEMRLSIKRSTGMTPTGWIRLGLAGAVTLVSSALAGMNGRF